jgi:hypothetical protein
MAVNLQQAPRTGNGFAHSPLSSKHFRRALPGRLGAIEDEVYRHDRQLDAVLGRLSAIESHPATTGPDPGLAARLEAIVGIVEILARTRRSRVRRKSAAIADLFK